MFFVLLAGLCTSAFAHTDISIPDANDMIGSNPDLIVVDVREASDYCGSLGHIAGALNYPWNSGYFGNHYQDFAIDDQLLLVCHSGGRSNSAANLLDSQGYLYVYDMLGGTSGWKNNGYETADCIDSDSDGFNDDLDNCPGAYNPSQTDSDGDGSGNACDPDCPNLDLADPVNLIDFALFAADWLVTVDPNDLTIFSLYWLADCLQ